MANVDVTLIRRLLEKEPENLVHMIVGLKSGGHGGGEAMEARIARLESDVAHIQRDVSEVKLDIRELRGDIKDVRADGRADFRLTWGGMIVGFLGMATLMAKGFNWLN